MVLPDIIHPPILPEVAFTLPDILALVANKSPAIVTLNGALPNVAFPKEIPCASALKILAPEPIEILPPLFNIACPPVKVVPPNVHPPIVPKVEVIVPVIVAEDAVSTPAFVTLNGALAAVACPTQILYVASSADNLTTSLPVPNVKFPVDDRVALPPVKVVAPIVHPPIAPAVAVIVPLKNALP